MAGVLALQRQQEVSFIEKAVSPDLVSHVNMVSLSFHPSRSLRECLAQNSALYILLNKRIQCLDETSCSLS